MIYGIGTDIVRIVRMEEALQRHGERLAGRILDEAEMAEWREAKTPARFLAKRFAAKEAFGKALGTGVAVPATLHALGIVHDERGKPLFRYSSALGDYLGERQLVAHLSLSDEQDYVLAFTVIECP